MVFLSGQIGLDAPSMQLIQNAPAADAIHTQHNTLTASHITQIPHTASHTTPTQPLSPSNSTHTTQAQHTLAPACLSHSQATYTTELISPLHAHTRMQATLALQHLRTVLAANDSSTSQVLSLTCFHVHFDQGDSHIFILFLLIFKVWYVCIICYCDVNFISLMCHVYYAVSTCILINIRTF